MSMNECQSRSPGHLGQNLDAGGGAGVRLLLIDGHELFRQGMAMLLAAEPDFQVIGQTRDADEAVAIARRERPDIALLDIDSYPAKILTRILGASPASRVIILTMLDEPWLVRDLLAVGAHGYVSKGSTREELLAIVRAIALDGARTILSVSRMTRNQLQHSPLSPRELQILNLVVRGMSSARIARELHITQGTVKHHLTHTYSKLGAVSRIDALNKALSIGVISLGDLGQAATPARPSAGGTVDA